MISKDDPELRARVKAELLYPVKEKREPVVAATQLQAIAHLYWYRRHSIAGLAERFGIPEAVIRDAVEEAA